MINPLPHAQRAKNRHIQSRLNNMHLIIYVVLMGAWLFDFSSERSGQGAAIQAIFLAIYVYTFMLFVVTDRSGGVLIPGLSGVILSCSLFVFVSFISGLSADQEIYTLLRNSIPALVYMSAAYATARAMFSIEAAYIRKWLTLLCAAYLISGVVIGFSTTAITLETTRYQILGGSITAGLSLLVLSAIFGQTRFEWATLFGAAAVTFISVTRSYILLVVVQALPLFRHPRVWLTGRMLAVLVAALVGVGIVLQFDEFGVNRWLLRLVGLRDSAGDDVTFLARVSELTYMYEAWTKSGMHLLFGNGIGAETEYFVSYRGEKSLEYSIGFGHNQYLSILFCGGIIGGLYFLLVTFHIIFRAIVLLLRFDVAYRIRSDILRLTYWGALMVIGVAVLNCLGAVFGNRAASLWFGIGTGLLLGGQACFINANRQVLSRLAIESRR